jgi:hypothetical protein
MESQIRYGLTTPQLYNGLYQAQRDSDPFDLQYKDPEPQTWMMYTVTADEISLRSRLQPEDHSDVSNCGDYMFSYAAHGTSPLLAHLIVCMVWCF